MTITSGTDRVRVRFFHESLAVFLSASSRLRDRCFCTSLAREKERENVRVFRKIARYFKFNRAIFTHD